MNGNHSSKDLIPDDSKDDREDEEYRTIYCGNLTSKIGEELLYELFLQAGPVEKVRIPTDKDGRPHPYGFVTFRDRCSVPYALSLFEDVTLYHTRLNLRPRKMDVYRKMPQSSVSTAAPPSKRIKLDNTPAESTTGRSSTNDHYKSESLRGRWTSKSDRDYLKPNYRRNNDRRRNNHRY